MQNQHKTTYKIDKTDKRVGIDTIKPYFINFLNGSSIPYRLRIDDHIMPARAPTGVRYAPILEPAIQA